MAFPASLDNLTTSASGNETLNTLGGGIGLAGLINNANTAINSLETKVGIDGSVVTTTIDYLLKNSASIDPGHHHTNSTIDSVASSKITGETFPASGLIVGTTDTQTLTNKSMDGSSNTFTNIGTTAISDAAVTSRKMKLDQIQAVTSTTDLNTASNVYVDYTGLTATFTPNVASNLLVMVSITSFCGSATERNSFVVVYDGTIKGNDPLIEHENEDAANGNFHMTNAGFVWITGVTSASHTVKVQAKCSAGTLHTVYGSMTVIPFAS